MSPSKCLTGLDIGTTKISVVLAELSETGEAHIVGVGTAPSEGLRKGVVVNLEQTVRSIEKAVEEAERMAGLEVKGVYAGIAGDHIRSINSRGVIAVSRRDDEITQNDVDRVVEAARAVSIPADREIFHVIPQEFTVDDQDGIKDPVGMSGVRLEAEVHIVTGASTSARNVVKAIQRAGLRVEALVLEPLASAYAVLAEDEKDLGVVLLDVGGGTTDVAVFFEGAIRHTAIIGLGGANVTNDIAIGLRTPVDRAEEIKLNHGCALASLVDKDESLVVPGVGGRAAREISRHLLATMIEPRLEEIFGMALKEVKKNHYAQMLGGGVVVTGGASAMEGVPELAEQIFEMPVRRGVPGGVSGLKENVLDPRYATGVGLILYAREEERPNGRTESGLVGRVAAPLARWFSEFF